MSWGRSVFICLSGIMYSGAWGVLNYVRFICGGWNIIQSYNLWGLVHWIAPSYAYSQCVSIEVMISLSSSRIQYLSVMLDMSECLVPIWSSCDHGQSFETFHLHRNTSSRNLEVWKFVLLSVWSINELYFSIRTLASEQFSVWIVWAIVSTAFGNWKCLKIFPLN